MRRLLVLGVALGMMWGLQLLRVPAASGPADPRTLAAIGFVVLAAFTVGELGAGLGLPKVTGYIVAGVLLGPSVSDILSGRVVSEMGVFNTLALGLIATNAGLELDLGAIRRISRTLFATVGAKLLLLPVFVGVPLFLVQRYHPVLPVEGMAATAVLALVVAVLAIGTSPAIALAVVEDSRAHGRLSDLVLAIAVVKDLVVVVCLAGAVAVGRAVLAGGGYDPRLLLGLATEIGGSLLVGAAVGLLLIQYIRRVHAEMLVAVLVVILLVSELSRFLHLELLLVFIAAGFVVRNLSDYEHELLAPLSRMSVPVYVVFFTTAGGGVDLATTLALLPLALLLVAGRATAFALAGRIGCRIGGETPAVTRNAWMTYLPQAGVTLGLVLIASQALPQLAEPILRLGMAFVAVNLLVGPVTLAIGLRRAGETPGEPPAPSPHSEPGPAAIPEESAAEAQAPDVLLPIAAEPALAGPIRQLADDLATDVRESVLPGLEPLVSATRDWAGVALAPAPDPSGLLRQIGAALEGGEPDPGQGWETGLLGQLDGMVKRLHVLPVVVWIPFDPGLLRARRGDSAGLRVRLLLKRLGLRLNRLRGRPALRRTPMRRAARVALEPRLAEAAAVAAASGYRTRAAILALLGESAAGTRDSAEAAVEIEKTLALWVDQLVADFDHAVRHGLAETARTLSVAGSPRLSESELAFSLVEGRVRAARDRIVADAGPWRGHLRASQEALRATLHLERAALAVGRVLGHRALDPLFAARAALAADLEDLEMRLERLSADAAALSPERPEEAARLLAGCREIYPEATQARHRKKEARLRQDTQSHRIVADLEEVISSAPSGGVVVPSRTSVTRAARPAAVDVRTVDLAEELESVLVDELIPALTAVLSRAVEEVNRAEGRARDLASSTAFAVELAMDERHVAFAARGPLVVETLARAVGRGRSITVDFLAAMDEAERKVRELEEETTGRLRRVLRDEPRSAATRAQASVRWTRRRLSAILSRQHGALGARWHRLAASARWLGQGAFRDLRIRAGQESLDRAAIRAYLHSRHPSNGELRLPPLLRRLYAPIPLDDRRLFVAHRFLLDRLLEGVEGLQKGDAPAVLVTGPRGTGRSSLLNVFRLQLAGQHLVWLDDSLAIRSEGLLGALAVEAGASPSVAATAAALAERRSVVVIDNLEHWFLPTPRGVEQLEAFLQLVIATTGRVLWVVSVGATPLSVLADLLPLGSTFSRVLRTRPLEWEELSSVMEARERMSGVETTYSPRQSERWLHRLGLREERESHFRSLERVSRGNLRAALIAHARSLRNGAERAVRATTPHLSPLPFLQQLPPDSLAVLALAMRWGPMGEPDLGEALAMPEPALKHAVTHLLGCGLLAPQRPGPSAPLEVPVHLEPPLAMALAEMGLHAGVAP